MSDTTKGERGTRPGPLAGIRIVECATWHAAPGGDAILADLGADVIKIETPAGDPERKQKGLGAVRFDQEEKRPGWSFLFEASNRGKRGVCIDIKTEKGQEIVHDLVREADVFVTNLRQTTKPKYRMDYETLSRINPRIIHANMSGFGPKGPMGNTGGFDPLGQAISGMMFLADDKEPVYLQAVILDQMASILFSHSIMAAIIARDRQGVGQELHVSLFSAALMLMYVNTAVTSILGKNPVTRWNRAKNLPLRNNFLCRDGKWIVGTNHPEQKYWGTFCRVMGVEHLENDPRFATTDSRLENSAELTALFDKVFLQKDSDDWMRIFIEAGLLFAPIQNLADAIRSPQALANDYVVDFRHPVFGDVLIPGYPASFSANAAGTRKTAPDLGEHTDEVMQEIGLTPDQIRALKQSGILVSNSGT